MLTCVCTNLMKFYTIIRWTREIKEKNVCFLLCKNNRSRCYRNNVLQFQSQWIWKWPFNLNVVFQNLFIFALYFRISFISAFLVLVITCAPLVSFCSHTWASISQMNKSRANWTQRQHWRSWKWFAWQWKMWVYFAIVWVLERKEKILHLPPPSSANLSAQ